MNGNESNIPLPPISDETRRFSLNFKLALKNPNCVSITEADYKILAALSRGAVLRDVYKSGYKLTRAPFSERTLTLSDGAVKKVGRPAIERLRMAGIIATPDYWSDVPGNSYDATWRLTTAGLAASPNPDAEVETYDPPPKVEADTTHDLDNLPKLRALYLNLQREIDERDRRIKELQGLLWCVAKAHGEIRVKPADMLAATGESAVLGCYTAMTGDYVVTAYLRASTGEVYPV